jgi:regulator of nucleoside diphosphate kinase
MNAHRELPPITLTTSDYNNLLFTAVLSRQLGNPDAEFLMAEVRRAFVCHPDDLPDDLVSTNCLVIYRIDGEPKTDARLLVHPKDLIFPSAELSVMTPLGTALLGLRVGDRMPYRAADGQPQQEVTVEGIGMRLVGEGTPSRTFQTELPGDRAIARRGALH